MFTVNLAAVERGETRLEGGLSADDPFWEEAGLSPAGPLRLDLEIGRVGDGILVRGRMKGSFVGECRRCLAEVAFELDEPIDLLYESFADEEEERELSGEVYALPKRGAELDLRPALREQLLLRIPTHILCDEACRGLCPRCGTNLNETTCSCSPERVDDTWDALKKLEFD